MNPHLLAAPSLSTRWAHEITWAAALLALTLIFGLYFLPAQAQATQEESVEFTVIPEPEGGKTISYPLDTVIQDPERWAYFWNDLHPGKPVPAIDFERCMVVSTGGRCRIAGTRIKVTLVAFEYEYQRMTPDEIIEAHPHLSLAQIHAVLVYYCDHQDEIRREWREAEELISSQRDRYPRRLGRAEGPA